MALPSEPCAKREYLKRIAAADHQQMERWSFDEDPEYRGADRECGESQHVR
jgi:hypothetical protein